uniref:F-box domain-containing protein n=1 Tax=Panagrellus redivivus TaxID=6233 RepID=A0A7E4VIA7_PANRE
MIAPPTLLTLPIETQVEVFKYLDFQSLFKMRETCFTAATIIDRYVKQLAKCPTKRLTLQYLMPTFSCQVQRGTDPMCQMLLDDGISYKVVPISDDEDLQMKLKWLNIGCQMFLDVYNHDFCSHLAWSPGVKHVQNIEISNITLDTPVSKLTPFLRRLECCHGFSLSGRCLLTGNANTIVQSMEYCEVLRLVKAPRLIFDDSSLATIAAKSTKPNPTLLIHIGDVGGSITADGLIAFLRGTHFTSRTVVQLPRVVANRDQLIIDLCLEPNYDNEHHFDLNGIYISDEGGVVRLQIGRIVNPISLNNSF